MELEAQTGYFTGEVAQRKAGEFLAASDLRNGGNPAESPLAGEGNRAIRA
jgi:hypothetical protein